MPTKAINLRIDTELLEYLQKRADKEHRTLSNMIISLLLTERERDSHQNTTYFGVCPVCGANICSAEEEARCWQCGTQPIKMTSKVEL